MSQASFPLLPPEILQMICSPFCSHCQIAATEKHLRRTTLASPATLDSWPWQDASDTRTLINLASTCRSLCRFVLPFAYHHIHTTEWSPAQASHLLRSLSVAPCLGSFVNSLTIQAKLIPQGLGNDLLRVAGRRKMLSPGVPMGYYRTLIDKPTARGRKRLYTPLPHEVVEDRLPDQAQAMHNLLVDVLVSSMPNIRHLSLDISSTAKLGNYLPDTFKLHHLRYLHICCSTGAGDSKTHFCDLISVDSLFEKAPNIVSLEIQLGGFCEWWITPLLRFEKLRSLKLINSLIPRAGLKRLTQRCPRLEKFILVHAEDAKDSSILKALPDMLFPCRETLRYVEVYWKPWQPRQPVPSIGSFSKLTNLKTLVLGGESLRVEYGEDGNPTETSLIKLLPPSINSVWIEGQHLDLYAAMLALAEEAKKGSFPRLESVAQTGFQIEKSSYPPGSLENLTRDSGIEFRTFPKSAFSLAPCQ